uniref:Uncharacterized protein n=1 Tax=Romanomermis culicivorax TaxID=13658 RepID=A0A915KFY8_ROMCU
MRRKRNTELPEDYLIDCLIHGREPDLNYMGPKPYIPSEIIAIKWIEQPRTLSFVSEKVMASVESLDVTSRCSAAKTPREWYYHMILEHMKDTKI